ncbi:MAG: trypsin-like serine protease [Nannocystaceae bacterium]
MQHPSIIPMGVVFVSWLLPSACSWPAHPQPSPHGSADAESGSTEDASGGASDDVDGPVADLPASSPIYGGEPVPECGWPSAVALLSERSLCSGTLIHPRLVVYAAHCGTGFSQVRFGESVRGAGLQWVVPVEHCDAFPGAAVGEGNDVAYCALAEAVDDVPIVPPLLGCEREQLRPGAVVSLVGFGLTEYGSSGTKREAVASLRGLTDAHEAWIGGDGVDTCQGDSGGPAFLRLDDGTWRVFGITSWGEVCGGGGYYSLVSRAIPWLEQQTGLDLSPCTEADGSWAPGPGCAGVPIEPGEGHGQWGQGCAGGPTSGALDVCGPPWSAGDGCEGWCGEQAAAGCWCDEDCVYNDDCCPDAAMWCEAWLPTCEDWCGGQAAGGCWCDDECIEHDDCCPDLELHCE